MHKVVIVDYGMGNIKSVQRGLEKVGASVILSSDPDEIKKGDYLVLPGVGAFEEGMNGLRKAGVIDALGEFVQTGKPFLGICLGMQMLMERSEEHGIHEGLAYIPGSVIEIPTEDDGRTLRKIPHIGWNELEYPLGKNDWNRSLLSEVKESENFYFVHSFMAMPTNPNHLLAECEYERIKLTAGIRKDNVTGLQFHPEKSGGAGLKILQQFVDGR